jgi:hypothetical protein
VRLSEYSVGILLGSGWAQLDQVFNHEPVFAEHANPCPVDLNVVFKVSAMA